MRLDKFLSNMGCGSRRDVHKLIAAGAVEVDGSVVKAKDAQID
ncbi:MAG: 16S rRNA pseudouridine(516) synthase, partial [Clostridia bacterium]|nr:16S rRNA pseudouridine(516) synthase [Clostridia bacterium]